MISTHARVLFFPSLKFYSVSCMKNSRWASETSQDAVSNGMVITIVCRLKFNTVNSTKIEQISMNTRLWRSTKRMLECIYKSLAYYWYRLEPRSRYVRYIMLLRKIPRISRETMALMWRDHCQITLRSGWWLDDNYCFRGLTNPYNHHQYHRLYVHANMTWITRFPA